MLVIAASMSASVGLGFSFSSAAAALMKEKRNKLTAADVDAAISNICRCGTYNRVRAGILQAVGVQSKDIQITHLATGQGAAA